MSAFWNRLEELAEIKRHTGKAAFGYVTGRRRVGKTALLQQAIGRCGGIYHQAVEGTVQQQLLHLVEEVKDGWPIFRDVTPKTWSEFFRLLARETLPLLVVFDEFPYWTAADPSLPSVLQKWIDHELPKKRACLVVSGSSQSMLYSQFLDRSAPLYGRASFHLDLEPMSYPWFCRALGYEARDPESFARFTLVGGVPHYWKLLPKGAFVTQAERLYFEPSAVLAEEPIHLVRDEGITGALPKAILDLVGRGVSKPSELGSRLGTVQGNLSRPLALLVSLGLIHRELPFGESPRTTKRVLYSIQDPALSFYYGTFLPFRSRWDSLPRSQKGQVLRQHVSRQWEHFCRQLHPGSGRYWEAGVEIDLVGYRKRQKRHLVAECKWARLSKGQERTLLRDLRTRFFRTKLSRHVKRVDFRILTQQDLPELVRA